MRAVLVILDQPLLWALPELRRAVETVQAEQVTHDTLHPFAPAALLFLVQVCSTRRTNCLGWVNKGCCLPAVIQQPADCLCGISRQDSGSFQWQAEAC